METKNISLEIKQEDLNEEKKIFIAYASTFGNKDFDGDVILKGAFLSSIKKFKDSKGKVPKLAFQHDTSRLPGKILDLKEDDLGLLMEAQFIDTQEGRDRLVEVKEGVITDVSIGFNILDSEQGEKLPRPTFFGRTHERIIKEVELFEVSLVSFPANPKAEIISMKSREEKKRYLENFLRSLGAGREKAKTVCSDVFKQLSLANEEDSSMRDALEEKESLAVRDALEATTDGMKKIESIFKGD